MLSRLAVVILIGAASIVGAFSTVSVASTWRVELDGNGDFDDIQPAVEAAAEGDTIRIGPGRFDTLRPFQSPAWTEDVVVGVTKNNLTFIGSGVGVTIVGTETPYSPYGENPKGFCAIVPLDCSISGMTIENIERGIYWSFGNLTVHNCEFRGTGLTYRGLGGLCDSLDLNNCVFHLADGAGGVGIYSGSTDVHISNCQFIGSTGGTCVIVAGASGVNVSDCDFSGVVAGLQYEQQSSGVVSGCTVRQSSVVSAAVFGRSQVGFVDCEFDNSLRGIDVSTGSNVFGESVSISNTTEYAIMLTVGSSISLKNSHVLPASGLAVWCASYSSPTLFQDLTGNYWGTTDVDAIAEMIWDGNDDPDLHSVVNYLPVADGPLSVETKSWGNVKALFR